MKNAIKFIPDIVSYFFILLFCYAAISKSIDFENFQVQIGQSPLLSAYADYVSYAVIMIELLIVGMLVFPKARLIGLYTATALMSAFTVYIFLILNYSDFVPCSCGGILEKLGWTEHLIFNIACVTLGILAVCRFEKKHSKSIVKTSILLSATNILSCLLIIFLFFSSEYIVKKDNNFTRRFLIHPVIEDKVLDLKVNSYYFAGIDNSTIYLGSITAPLIMSEVDQDLSQINKRKINLSHKDYTFRNLQVQTLKNWIFIYDGTVPVIYRGDLSTLNAKMISHNDAYFTQLLAIDSFSFALRTQTVDDQKYSLALLNLEDSVPLTLKRDILQKQIDGVFDSDGYFIKDNNTRKLIYAYSYRNQLMVMNEKLRLENRLKTIDTVSHAQIKVTELSDGRRKMSAPPLKINKGLAANRNIVFVYSTSMAKNELAKSWNDVSVVDMYFSDRQEYAGSFYIKNRNGEKISKMIATDQFLFVIIGSELIRYRFTKPIKNLYRSGEAENLNKE